MDQEIRQIRIGGNIVGVRGLKQAVEEMARDWGDLPDRTVADELMKRLSQKNYIPDRAQASYKAAFLREFKSALGRPREEAPPRGLEIKVLGQGCSQCDRLVQELMTLLAELDLMAEIDHVRDLKQIGTYGVMGMPALIINGQVKSVGSVPARAQLRKWLAAESG